MRIRRFLCALAVAAGAGLALPAVAQTTMKMNISVAQNSH